MSTRTDTGMALLQCPQTEKLFQKCFSGNVLTWTKNHLDTHINFPSLYLYPVLKIRITPNKGQEFTRYYYLPGFFALHEVL